MVVRIHQGQLELASSAPVCSASFAASQTSSVGLASLLSDSRPSITPTATPRRLGYKAPCSEYVGLSIPAADSGLIGAGERSQRGHRARRRRDGPQNIADAGQAAPQNSLRDPSETLRRWAKEQHPVARPAHPADERQPADTSHVSTAEPTLYSARAARRCDAHLLRSGRASPVWTAGSAARWLTGLGGKW